MEKKQWFALVFFPIFLFAAEVKPELENKNIYQSSDDNSIDYNRVRFTATVKDDSYENFYGKVIVDNENYNDFNGENNNTTDFYRYYLSYQGENSIVTVGLQRVPFGVGRVWNPVDVFNPINSFSIDSSEREGVKAARVEYFINDLSGFDVVAGEEKVGFRLKGFLEYGDFGIIGVKDEEKKVLGAIFDGEIPDIGIGTRIEGGQFFLEEGDTEYTDFIIGADYGFENSLIAVLEYRNNSLYKREYGAATLSYTFSPLFTGNFIHIASLEDGSSFSSPVVSYSVSDDSTFKIGAMVYSGDATDEFGHRSDMLFADFFIQF